MTHKKSLLELEQSDKYGSVVISNCGCDISLELSTQHFSFEQVPYLPLPGCTSNNCTCEYKGIIDRRVEDRRNTDNSVSIEDDKRIVDRREIPLLILGDAIDSKD